MCVLLVIMTNIGMQQVSITMIATGFGSGVVEAALRPAARRQPQQQQQQTSPRQVPVERWALPSNRFVQSPYSFFALRLMNLSAAKFNIN